MGIALRPSLPEFAIVKQYYDVAKREPTRRGDLEIASTDAFKPNFLDLVKMLASKQQSHVVIASHGYEGGLLLPLTDKTKDDADTAVLKDLSELVDEYPTFSDKKIAIFAKGYKVPTAQVKELIVTCSKIRNHQSNCTAVHIRGCNVGKNDDNLLTIRELFGSLVVSAPTCPMLYTPFSPKWHPRGMNVDTWKSDNKPDTRRREFSDSGAGRSRLVLDLDESGVSASTQGVIESAGDLTKWADVIYKNSSHGTQHAMPVAAMWPESGYFLPHETGYVDQIAASRNG